MKQLPKIVRHNFVLLAAIFFSLTSLSTPVRAQTSSPTFPVYIYLFWGEGCPHCAKAKPYFEQLAADNPEIQLHIYEVYYDEENQKLFSLMAEKFGIERLAVPTIFVGSYYLQGYAEEYNPSIEEVVNYCIQNDCGDPGLVMIDATKANVTATAPSVSATSQATETFTSVPSKQMTPTSTPEMIKTPILAAPDSTLTDSTANLNLSSAIEIPFLGQMDLDSTPPVVTTAIIALVDGFNPCSLWVLTMLLALTLHTGSRKKVFTIGIVFLTVTAGIYALFIAGLFSILKITSAMGWIRFFVALIALFFAVVNIKDYFWFKDGISLTIADEQKPGIIKRMRSVIDASQSFTGLIGATVALAVGVSMVEFSCTAGFPVIWTNILTAQNISGAAFVVLLVIYMMIYQLDELIIFFSSVTTLKVSRIEEKHGRVLKLISGMLMLTLSIVMLVNPALLNSLTSSLLIFGIAFLATFFIWWLQRFLLPKLGIHIGSEDIDKKSKKIR